MNYRHGFHAGNFADVFKHVLLIALTKTFLRKESAFCYLDTHAGAGRYDLMSESAKKSKEYENGICKVLLEKDAPELIQEYCALIKTGNSPLRFYPGSPEIVKHYLRQQDRMMLCELHPEEYTLLKKNFAHKKNIAIHHQDAYQSLKALLPPKEKRGLILIDPPYEKADEFSQIISSLPLALKRFATGVYAVWYPIKNRQPIERFHCELKEKVKLPIAIYELLLYPDNLPTHFNGCGMIIINPPYQLDEQIKPLLSWLKRCFLN